MTPFDLETWPIQDGRPLPKPVAVGFDKLYRWEDWGGFGEHKTIVGLFLPFDLACVCQYKAGGLKEVFEGLQHGRFKDVAVREQLIDIAKGVGTKRSYSLQAIAERRLGKKVEKEDSPRLKFWKVEGVQPEQWPSEFRSYLSSDLELPLEIYDSQEKDPHFLNKSFEDFELYSSFCLYLMSCWGIRADPIWVKQLISDAEGKYKKLQEKFRLLGVLREDGTQDKKRLQELVTKAYNDQPPRTDKGAVKTDKLTLEESGDPTLEELTGDGPIVKILTTYRGPLEEACVRPYNSKYKVLVSSGRTSGNFQQWPRGGPNAPDEVNRLRAGFVARPGYLFCSCDITGAELGSLAQVCMSLFGWSKIAEALNEGQDLHLRLVSFMLGADYGEILARFQNKDKEIKNLRQAAKAPNFGLPGKMGCHRLVLSAHKDGAIFCELLGRRTACGGSQCKECHQIGYQLIAAHRRAFPCVYEFHRWVDKQNLDPFVTPITGFVRGGLFPSEAANQPFQHLTSRAAKLALQRFSEAAYFEGSACFGSRGVVFAHDEIIAEVPEHTAHEAGLELARIVREATKVYTPDVAVKVEPALMRRWWKGAEPVYKEGRLVPWEPS